MTINYRDTLNLPETDLSMKAGLANKEPEIIDLWNSLDLYNEIRARAAGKTNLYFMMDLPMQMVIFILVIQLTRFLKI